MPAPKVTDLGEFYKAKGREEYRRSVFVWLDRVEQEIEQSDPDAPVPEGEAPLSEAEKVGALAVIRVLKGMTSQ